MKNSPADGVAISKRLNESLPNGSLVLFLFFCASSVADDKKDIIIKTMSLPLIYVFMRMLFYYPLAGCNYYSRAKLPSPCFLQA
jgi:hypothetical protein